MPKGPYIKCARSLGDEGGVSKMRAIACRGEGGLLPYECACKDHQKKVDNFIQNDKFLKVHEGINWKEENYGCGLQSRYLQIGLTFVKAVQKVGY